MRSLDGRVPRAAFADGDAGVTFHAVKHERAHLERGSRMRTFRREIRWFAVGAALLAGTASARTLAGKNQLRGLPAVQQKLLAGELDAEWKGRLAELHALLEGAALPGNKEREKLARHLQSRSASYRKDVARILGDAKLDPRAKTKALAELAESNQKTLDDARRQANVTESRLRFEVPRKVKPNAAIGISSSLPAGILQLKKQVFKGPFPLQLEWSDPDSPNQIVSPAKSASSSGSFSSSILLDGNVDSATEADPGVEFSVPDSVDYFVVSATLEIESTSAYANPDDSWVYCLTEGELRVWSYDYVANVPHETEILISMTASHPGETTSETQGPRTVTLQSVHIPNHEGAKYHAFAGGVINVTTAGGGVAFATIQGKVKDITVHHQD
jgi:hypothetical protein